MFETVYSTAGVLALFSLLVAAAWKGGRPEQIGLGMLALCWAASFAAQAWALHQHLAAWWFGIDAALLSGFMALGLRSRRDWPFIAAVFQAVNVAIHIATYFDAAITGTIHVAAVAVATLGILGAIAWGVGAAAARSKGSELVLG